MAQELTLEKTTLTITTEDSVVSAGDALDPGASGKVKNLVDKGQMGWVDIVVTVESFGFCGKAYLAGVAYKSLEDLRVVVTSYALVEEALSDLISKADDHGWNIVKPDGFLADLIREKMQFGDIQTYTK